MLILDTELPTRDGRDQVARESMNPSGGVCVFFVMDKLIVELE